MSLFNGSKGHLIMIFDHSAHTEPIVIELLLSVLPSKKAGKGDCDVTGRVLNSQYSMNNVCFPK